MVVVYESPFDYIRLRELRKSRQLTAKIFAEEAGCGPNHLSKIENGKASPGAKLAARMAQLVDVPLESLYLPPGTRSAGVAARLSSDEDELLDAYRLLSPSYKDFVQMLAINLTQDETGEAQDQAVEMARGYQASQDNRRASAKSAKQPSKKAVG